MSPHKSPADFIPVIPWAEMTDWQVVEGHRSSASCSPGAQVMVRPHPQVLSLLRATAETSPLGCYVPPSRLHGDEATGRPRLRLAPFWSVPPSLRGESSLPYSNRTQVAIAATPTPPLSLFFFLLLLPSSLKPVRGARRPTVHPTLPWQCYPCEACWEQWWDVRLDLQVWAGPERRGTQRNGTLSVAHAPLWFYLRVWKLRSQKLSPLRSSHYWLLKKTGCGIRFSIPRWSCAITSH